jgi:hypothetical protein
MSQPSPNAAQTVGPACADFYDLASRFAAAAERALARHEPDAGSDVGETDLRSRLRRSVRLRLDAPTFVRWRFQGPEGPFRPSGPKNQAL